MTGRSARQYLGDEGASQLLAMIGAPGADTRMARIGLRPTWVGVLDFQARTPGVMAG